MQEDTLRIVMEYLPLVEVINEPQHISRFGFDHDILTHSYKTFPQQLHAVSVDFNNKVREVSRNGFFVSIHFFSDKILDERTRTMRVDHFLPKRVLELNHAVHFVKKYLHNTYKKFDLETEWNYKTVKFGCSFQSTYLETNNWHFSIFPVDIFPSSDED